MDTAYYLFILLGFSAAIISAVFGFGTALIVLAVGSNLLPVKECIALATVLFATSTITKTVLFNKYIDWPLAITMSVVSLPFAYLGALVLNDLPPDVLSRSLGVMVLIYLCATRSNWIPPVSTGRLAITVGSAAYGFMSGVLGSGNLIKAILFRELSLRKEAFVGAMAATSVFSNMAKLAAYSQNGQLNSSQTIQIVCLICAALLAVFAGRFLLTKVSHHQFEHGVVAVLVVSAIALLV